MMQLEGGSWLTFSLNLVSGKICGFHSPVMEKSGLLECDFASLDKWFPTIPRNVRQHFTSYAVSHPKILKYWLKFFCTDFKTNRTKNTLPNAVFRCVRKSVIKLIILVMSLCLSVRPTACLSLYLSVRLSVCLYVRLSVWLSAVCVLPSVPFIHPHEQRLPLDGFSWRMIFNYFSKFCQRNLIFIKVWQ